jgi:hypothetical protein
MVCLNPTSLIPHEILNLIFALSDIISFFCDCWLHSFQCLIRIMKLFFQIPKCSTMVLHFQLDIFCFSLSVLDIRKLLSMLPAIRAFLSLTLFYDIFLVTRYLFITAADCLLNLSLLRLEDVSSVIAIPKRKPYQSCHQFLLI